jgi:spore coat protein CotH
MKSEWIRVSVVSLVLVACAPSEEVESLRQGLAVVFPQDRVVQFHFEPQGGYEAMVQDYLNSGISTYVPSTMVFEDEEYPSVGLRLRADEGSGGGKNEIKYSLRANFDYFGGDRLHRVDKVYFGNNKPDPSLMRSRLASLLFEDMGVAASRTSYGWIAISQRPAALYTMVQVVDKPFLKDHFGTTDHADDGNLYRCVPPGCSLEWSGNRRGDYVSECKEDTGCGLILETNLDDPDKNDYADLIAFLDVLNRTPDSRFPAEIETVLEVDSFLRALAVLVVMGEVDSILGSPDNFYLYHRPDTGRFQFIPWDHNKSFGAKSCPKADHATGAGIVTPWCDDSPRPLVTRVLAVPAFRQAFEQHVSSEARSSPT